MRAGCATGTVLVIGVVAPAAPMTVGLDEQEEVARTHLGIVCDPERDERAARHTEYQLAPFPAHGAERARGFVGLDPVLDQPVLLAAHQLHEQLGVTSP
ncbi:MAG: hypothetical protein M0Z42_00030 [Actinomycetota bacterium]|nr:hypothetical protein [Actinomycetota bacterium]